MSLRTDVSAALGNAAFQQGLSALKAGDRALVSVKTPRRVKGSAVGGRVVAKRGQGDAVGTGDADSRRPAHDETADGVDELGDLGAPGHRLGMWEQRLIDQLDGAVDPGDGGDFHGVHGTRRHAPDATGPLPPRPSRPSLGFPITTVDVTGGARHHP